MEKRRTLSSIVKRIEETRCLYEKYIADDNLEDYSLPVYNASLICEILISEVLKINGEKVNNNMVIKNRSSSSNKPQKEWVVSFLMNSEVNYLPERYVDFFKIIYTYRKRTKNGIVISQGEMNEFIRVYECFLVWFFYKYKPESVFKCEPEDMLKLLEFFYNKVDFWRRAYEKDSQDCKTTTESTISLDPKETLKIALLGDSGAFGITTISSAAALMGGIPGVVIGLLSMAGMEAAKRQKRHERISNELNQGLEFLMNFETIEGNIESIKKSKPEEIERIIDVEKEINSEGVKELEASMRTVVEDATTKLLEAINDSSKEIKVKLDDISLVLDSLMKQINQFQTFVENQIEIAVSDEEIDRIVHVYASTCVDKIVAEIDKKYSDKARQKEEEQLKTTLGSAWDKLSDESKNYLVSAKVTYSYYTSVHSLDYSGVCLLVTKALELEMSRRFYYDYVAFLKKGFEDSWKNHIEEFPTTLIKTICGKKKLKSATDFTLGAVPYVLCANVDSGADEAQQKNNEMQLIRFVKSGLMDAQTPDNVILEKLKYYGSTIGDISRDYRNKAAHTNALKKVDADECFELVIDVEKLLKVILDSFNY